MSRTAEVEYCESEIGCRVVAIDVTTDVGDVFINTVSDVSIDEVEREIVSKGAVALKVEFPSVSLDVNPLETCPSLDKYPLGTGVMFSLGTSLDAGISVGESTALVVEAK